MLNIFKNKEYRQMIELVISELNRREMNVELIEFDQSKNIPVIAATLKLNVNGSTVYASEHKEDKSLILGTIWNENGESVEIYDGDQCYQETTDDVITIL
ncbi:hypothetical protein [Aeromonas popoffii]|uniref:hypothetical protein n=1 Tax=Aeromonas popoffii TaxID=70856 RepID=UPI0030D00E0D